MLKSFKSLQPMSDKMKIRLNLYHNLRKEYLLKHPKCEACECEEATQIHHKARRGANLNKTQTWMAVCFGCHRKIEENGRWARQKGYLL